MVTWYKHDIPAWMDGTEALDDGPYRAYHVICELIYLHEGPILLNEQGIAGRCNQHILAFRHNLKTLIGLGKLALVDGRLSNERAAIELQLVDNHRATSAKGGVGSRGVGKGSAGGLKGVGHRLQGGLANNPLKNNGTATVLLLDPQHHKTRLDETREEKKEADIAKAMPRLIVDDDADLFRRGREVLGKAAGGVVKKLLTAKGGRINEARAAIETAAGKNDPREYIGAIIRKQEIPDSADRKVDPRL